MSALQSPSKSNVLCQQDGRSGVAEAGSVDKFSSFNEFFSVDAFVELFFLTTAFAATVFLLSDEIKDEAAKLAKRSDNVGGGVAAPSPSGVPGPLMNFSALE